MIPIMVRPYSSQYKIYIVDEAQKNDGAGPECSFKDIEEPPAYAVIMLLTTNQDAFLQTSLSSCVQLKLKPLKDSVVKTYLEEKLQVKDIQAEIYSALQEEIWAKQFIWPSQRT